MRQSLSKQRLVPCACDRQRLKQRSLLNIILCLLALGLPRLLFAIDPHQPMSQMEHSAWSARDGLDGEVSALAQTTDGYLWLGCTTGLYRYDGQKFQRYKPSAGDLPSNQIQTLLATPDGGLWVGFIQSGAAFLKSGQVTAYSSPDKFPVGRVRKFVRSPDGFIWAAVTGGFVRLVSGKWEVVGKGWKYSGNSPDTLFIDHTGTLWAATGQKIQFLLPGQHEFHDANVTSSVILSIVEAPDGGVWAVDGNNGELRRLRAPLQGDKVPQHFTSDSSSMMLFDRDGCLWIAASYDGLRRAAYPAQIPPHTSVQADIPAIELFTPHQGLSGRPTEQVLEDREGNIWVGTVNGLDRFRRRNLTWKPMPPDTFNSTLFRGTGSDVWAAQRGGGSQVTPGLVRLQDGAVAQDAPRSILESYTDPHGITWLSESNELWRWEKGKFVSVDLPLDLKKFVKTATMDTAGHLWIAVSGYGEFRRDGDQWTFLKPLPERPDLTANSSYADTAGNVWILYSHNIVMMHGDTIRRYDSAQDKAISPYNVVTGDGQHIWVGGDFGIAFFDGSHFIPITTSDGSPLEAITSVVLSSSSGLWLSSSGKLIHISQDEVKRAYGGARSVQSETYDVISDLPEPVLRGVEGSDGIVWFATTSNILRVDPAELRKNSLPPIIIIESLVADKHLYNTSNAVLLPPLTRNIEIDYAALSLTIPERVRSRYRLDNWDKDWQDGGLRRQVSYTNLPPGHYRFHVIAANNDGLWNDIGQSLDVDIRSAYYQTVWFLCLSIATGLLVLWLIYAMRLKSATNQVQARMIARLDERERIARELHDTFLQGLYALLLRFQTIADAVPEDTPVRKMMEDALNRADSVLLQGRESLRGLRGDPSLTMSVAEELEHLAQECRQDSQAVFTLSVTGQERALHPVIRDETIQIGKEAIFNSFRHSGAASLWVQLCYDRTLFSLTVADDGRGIDSEVLARGGKTGHWGMLGMRERSRKIGAQFSISARKSGGTEIKLRVSANLAYIKRGIFSLRSANLPFKKSSRELESGESN